MTIFGPASLQAGKEAQRFGGQPVTPTRQQPPTAGKSATTPTPRKPADRDVGKKFALTGWETDDQPEDGIVAFVRRQSIWESKRGTRKQPEILNAEFYLPTTHQCPCVDDFVAFKKESLHKRFLPKDRSNKRHKGILPAIPFNGNGQQPSSFGVITPSGFEQKDMAHYIEKDFDKREIETYREQKHGDPSETSRTVPEVNINDQVHKGVQSMEPRGMTYLNIKKLLKFTRDDRKRLKIEDDEDEGYSSKTSSAEAKEMESDIEGGDKSHHKNKLFASMVNLSELPSSKDEHDKTHASHEHDARIKFSYTHQPTILQLPDPNVQLMPERIKLERRVEREDNLSYARIKRAKELNRYYGMDQQPLPCEESTVYNIDNLKPMTLVLRKISIQDADKNVTSSIVPQTWSSQVNYDRPASSSPVRMNSRASRVGSAVSRAGSGISRTSSSQSQTDRSFSKNRPKSQYTSNRTNRSLIDPVDNDADTFVYQKDGEFPSNFQKLEKQATSYCIGDLLPAVDKNIYTNHTGKVRQGQESENRQEAQSKQSPTGQPNTGSGDGYVLLQKGMDMSSTGVAKSTLGPPPFRPNQTRHPLIRNVTVVVEKPKHLDSASSEIAELRSVASRGAMSYVVERGCPYLAHYVRDNYFDYAWLQPPTPDDHVSKTTVVMTTNTLPSSDSTTTHINWVNEVYKRFVRDYVPMELFKGLVNCGKEYALYAINAPSELTQALNVDYNAVPGIGK